MFRNVEQNAAAVALEVRILAAVGCRDLRAIEIDEHGRGARKRVTEVERAAATQQRTRRQLAGARALRRAEHAQHENRRSKTTAANADVRHAGGLRERKPTLARTTQGGISRCCPSSAVRPPPSDSLSPHGTLRPDRKRR
jgi:hypothetical protein